LRDALQRLRRARQFPRLCATFDAALAGAAAGAGTLPSDSSALDHVFTGSLLLALDRDQDQVLEEFRRASELAPADPRVKLMAAACYWLQGDGRSAADVLATLWDVAEPRPELHAYLAACRLRERDFASAARHLQHAEQDLVRVGRDGGLLRLDVSRIELALESGALDDVPQLLADGRSRHGEQAEFDVHEARLLLARGDRQQPPILLARAIERSEVPWTRRVAGEALLHLECLQFQGDDWDGTASQARADALLRRADEQLQAARVAGDVASEASACTRQFELNHHLEQVYLAIAEVDPDGSEVWRQRATNAWRAAWSALHGILAIDDLNEDATFYFTLDVVRRVKLAQEQGSGDFAAGLRLGDELRQARRRAVAITEQSFVARIERNWGIELAVFACYLSAVIGDEATALRMGGIAERLLAETDDDNRAAVQGTIGPLQLAAELLAIDRWPEAGR